MVVSTKLTTPLECIVEVKHSIPQPWKKIAFVTLSLGLSSYLNKGLVSGLRGGGYLIEGECGPGTKTNAFRIIFNFHDEKGIHKYLHSGTVELPVN